MHDVMRLADAHGHTTAVLAMHYAKNNPSPWEHFFVSNLETAHVGKGIAALRQLARTYWSYEAYKKTRAIICAFKPNVIHAHNLYTHLSPSVLSAAKDMGIPVVLTAHDYGYISANYGLFDGVTSISPRASWREIIKTKCIKNSALATGAVDAIVRIQKKLGMWTNGVTHILTASETVRRALVEGGYAKSRIQVLPLPSEAFDAFVETPFMASRMQRMIFASRFETYKGIDIVMELARRMPDVEFVCIGQGKEEKWLHMFSQKVKNFRVISFLPHRELWEMMRTSAGVLFPSRWCEPFGLITLEALGLGTPVIASNLGGSSEIVEHGISGFVEHPDNIDAWERDVRFLVSSTQSDRKEQQKMYQRARERGAYIGDPECHWERLSSIYSEAIHQGNGL